VGLGLFLPRINLRLQRANRAQIRRTGGGRQSTWISLANICQDCVGFVLGGERTESKAIAHTPVFSDLNLIHMRICAAGEWLCRNADRRSRHAEIDDEGSIAAEARRRLYRREQVFNAEVPDLPGRRRIYRCCHEISFQERYGCSRY
jgi:hypothetical protein